jgi:formylglycine-generating enzyme required for sulfatase activity
VASVFLPVGCSSLKTSIPDDFDKYTEDERPVHEVCLDGFWIGRYEVTQEQWLKIMGKNPSYFPMGKDFPVEQVSWDDITLFITTLYKKTGVRLVLPTEAQWEYAARSGGKDEVYSGSNDVRKVAWYYGNSGGKSHKVGTKSANGLGVYDMSGNLREWCRDMYAQDAYGKHSRKNPMYVSDKVSRVIRGGSWYVNPCDSRCASRGWDWKSHHNSDVGFRLVREQ